MKTFSGLAAIALLLGAVACGGSSKKALDPDLASGKKDRSGNMVAKAAEKRMSVPQASLAPSSIASA